MHIHMLSLQKQSSKTAVYITFRISHRQWQKHILHYNKSIAAFCLEAHAQACVCMLTSLCVCLSMDIHTQIHKHVNVCVCPYFSDVRLLAAIALFSHFPSG